MALVLSASSQAQSGSPKKPDDHAGKKTPLLLGQTDASGLQCWESGKDDPRYLPGSFLAELVDVVDARLAFARRAATGELSGSKDKDNVTGDPSQKDFLRLVSELLSAPPRDLERLMTTGSYGKEITEKELNQRLIDLSAYLFENWDLLKRQTSAVALKSALSRLMKKLRDSVGKPSADPLESRRQYVSPFNPYTLPLNSAGDIDWPKVLWDPKAISVFGFDRADYLVGQLYNDTAASPAMRLSPSTALSQGPKGLEEILKAHQERNAKERLQKLPLTYSELLFVSEYLLNVSEALASQSYRKQLDREEGWEKAPAGLGEADRAAAQKGLGMGLPSPGEQERKALCAKLRNDPELLGDLHTISEFISDTLKPYSSHPAGLPYWPRVRLSQLPLKERKVLLKEMREAKTQEEKLAVLKVIYGLTGDPAKDAAAVKELTAPKSKELGEQSPYKDLARGSTELHQKIADALKGAQPKAPFPIERLAEHGAEKKKALREWAVRQILRQGDLSKESKVSEGQEALYQLIAELDGWKVSHSELRASLETPSAPSGELKSLHEELDKKKRSLEAFDQQDSRFHLASRLAKARGQELDRSEIEALLSLSPEELTALHELVSHQEKVNPALLKRFRLKGSGFDLTPDIGVAEAKAAFLYPPPEWLKLEQLGSAREALLEWMERHNVGEAQSEVNVLIGASHKKNPPYFQTSEAFAAYYGDIYRSLTGAELIASNGKKAPPTQADKDRLVRALYRLQLRNTAGDSLPDLELSVPPEIALSPGGMKWLPRAQALQEEVALLRGKLESHSPGANMMSHGHHGENHHRGPSELERAIYGSYLRDAQRELEEVRNHLRSMEDKGEGESGEKEMLSALAGQLSGSQKILGDHLFDHRSGHQHPVGNNNLREQLVDITYFRPDGSSYSMADLHESVMNCPAHMDQSLYGMVRYHEIFNPTELMRSVARSLGLPESAMDGPLTTEEKDKLWRAHVEDLRMRKPFQSSLEEWLKTNPKLFVLALLYHGPKLHDKTDIASLNGDSRRQAVMDVVRKHYGLRTNANNVIIDYRLKTQTLQSASGQPSLKDFSRRVQELVRSGKEKEANRLITSLSPNDLGHVLDYFKPFPTGNRSKELVLSHGVPPHLQAWYERDKEGFNKEWHRLSREARAEEWMLGAARALQHENLEESIARIRRKAADEQSKFTKDKPREEVKPEEVSAAPAHYGKASRFLEPILSRLLRPIVNAPTDHDLMLLLQRELDFSPLLLQAMSRNKGEVAQLVKDAERARLFLTLERAKVAALAEGDDTVPLDPALKALVEGKSGRLARLGAGLDHAILALDQLIGHTALARPDIALPDHSGTSLEGQGKEAFALYKNLPQAEQARLRDALLNGHALPASFEALRNKSVRAFLNQADAQDATPEDQKKGQVADALSESSAFALRQLPVVAFDITQFLMTDSSGKPRAYADENLRKAVVDLAHNPWPTRGLFLMLKEPSLRNEYAARVFTITKARLAELKKKATLSEAEKREKAILEVLVQGKAPGEGASGLPSIQHFFTHFPGLSDKDKEALRGWAAKELVALLQSQGKLNAGSEAQEKPAVEIRRGKGLDALANDTTAHLLSLMVFAMDEAGDGETAAEALALEQSKGGMERLAPEVLASHLNREIELGAYGEKPEKKAQRELLSDLLGDIYRHTIHATQPTKSLGTLARQRMLEADAPLIEQARRLRKNLFQDTSSHQAPAHLKDAFIRLSQVFDPKMVRAAAGRWDREWAKYRDAETVNLPKLRSDIIQKLKKGEKLDQKDLEKITAIALISAKDEVLPEVRSREQALGQELSDEERAKQIQELANQVLEEKRQDVVRALTREAARQRLAEYEAELVEKKKMKPSEARKIMEAIEKIVPEHFETSRQDGKVFHFEIDPEFKGASITQDTPELGELKKVAKEHEAFIKGLRKTIGIETIHDWQKRQSSPLNKAKEAWEALKGRVKGWLGKAEEEEPEPLDPEFEKEKRVQELAEVASWLGGLRLHTEKDRKKAEREPGQSEAPPDAFAEQADKLWEEWWQNWKPITAAEIMDDSPWEKIREKNGVLAGAVFGPESAADWALAQVRLSEGLERSEFEEKLLQENLQRLDAIPGDTVADWPSEKRDRLLEYRRFLERAMAGRAAANLGILARNGKSRQAEIAAQEIELRKTLQKLQVDKAMAEGQKKELQERIAKQGRGEDVPSAEEKKRLQQIINLIDAESPKIERQLQTTLEAINRLRDQIGQYQKDHGEPIEELAQRAKERLAGAMNEAWKSRAEATQGTLAGFLKDKIESLRSGEDTEAVLDSPRMDRMQQYFEVRKRLEALGKALAEEEDRSWSYHPEIESPTGPVADATHVDRGVGLSKKDALAIVAKAREAEKKHRQEKEKLLAELKSTFGIDWNGAELSYARARLYGGPQEKLIDLLAKLSAVLERENETSGGTRLVRSGQNYLWEELKKRLIEQYQGYGMPPLFEFGENDGRGEAPRTAVRVLRRGDGDFAFEFSDAQVHRAKAAELVAKMEAENEKLEKAMTHFRDQNNRWSWLLTRHLQEEIRENMKKNGGNVNWGEFDWKTLSFSNMSRKAFLTFAFMDVKQRSELEEIVRSMERQEKYVQELQGFGHILVDPKGKGLVVSVDPDEIGPDGKREPRGRMLLVDPKNPQKLLLDPKTHEASKSLRLASAQERAKEYERFIRYQNRASVAHTFERIDNDHKWMVTELGVTMATLPFGGSGGMAMRALHGMQTAVKLHWLSKGIQTELKPMLMDAYGEGSTGHQVTQYLLGKRGGYYHSDHGPELLKSMFIFGAAGPAGEVLGRYGWFARHKTLANFTAMFGISSGSEFGYGYFAHPELSIWKLTKKSLKTGLSNGLYTTGFDGFFGSFGKTYNGRFWRAFAAQNAVSAGFTASDVWEQRSELEEKIAKEKAKGDKADKELIEALEKNLMEVQYVESIRHGLTNGLVMHWIFSRHAAKNPQPAINNAKADLLTLGEPFGRVRGAWQGRFSAKSREPMTFEKFVEVHNERLASYGPQGGKKKGPVMKAEDVLGQLTIGDVKTLIQRAKGKKGEELPEPVKVESAKALEALAKRLGVSKQRLEWAIEEMAKVTVPGEKPVQDHQTLSERDSLFRTMLSRRLRKERLEILKQASTPEDYAKALALAEEVIGLASRSPNPGHEYVLIAPKDLDLSKPSHHAALGLAANAHGLNPEKFMRFVAGYRLGEKGEGVSWRKLVEDYRAAGPRNTKMQQKLVNEGKIVAETVLVVHGEKAYDQLQRALVKERGGEAERFLAFRKQQKVDSFELAWALYNHPSMVQQYFGSSALKSFFTPEQVRRALTPEFIRQKLVEAEQASNTREVQKLLDEYLPPEKIQEGLGALTVTEASRLVLPDPKQPTLGSKSSEKQAWAERHFAESIGLPEALVQDALRRFQDGVEIPGHRIPVEKRRTMPVEEALPYIRAMVRPELEQRFEHGKTKAERDTAGRAILRSKPGPTMVERLPARLVELPSSPTAPEPESLESVRNVAKMRGIDGNRFIEFLRRIQPHDVRERDPALLLGSLADRFALAEKPGPNRAAGVRDLFLGNSPRLSWKQVQELFPDPVFQEQIIQSMKAEHVARAVIRGKEVEYDRDFAEPLARRLGFEPGLQPWVTIQSFMAPTVYEYVNGVVYQWGTIGSDRVPRLYRQGPSPTVAQARKNKSFAEVRREIAEMWQLKREYRGQDQVRTNTAGELIVPR